jgi:hypothetical protein
LKADLDALIADKRAAESAAVESQAVPDAALAEKADGEVKTSMYPDGLESIFTQLEDQLSGRPREAGHSRRVCAPRAVSVAGVSSVG